MKIDLNKSEVLLLKRALKHYAYLIYEGKEIFDGEVYDNPLKLKYKKFLLKNFAIIEQKINKTLYKNGHYKKLTGISNCWWLWTTTDKNWRKYKW